MNKTAEYKKALKTLLKEEIAPLFLENSFKKQANTFFLVEKDIVKFIDLEFFR